MRLRYESLDSLTHFQSCSGLFRSDEFVQILGIVSDAARRANNLLIVLRDLVQKVLKSFPATFARDPHFVTIVHE
jgi:hypothetical protein